jgi:hypothetical protein
MPSCSKSSSTAGRSAAGRNGHARKRVLTEVERVRRFLLESGFRRMTPAEMRRSEVVAAL